MKYGITVTLSLLLGMIVGWFIAIRFYHAPYLRQAQDLHEATHRYVELITIDGEIYDRHAERRRSEFKFLVSLLSSGDVEETISFLEGAIEVMDGQTFDEDIRPDS